jgi:glycosyltransferase involved in cell wall biosynthesis
MQYFEVGGLERMVLSLSSPTNHVGFESHVVAYEASAEFRDAFDEYGIPNTFLPKERGFVVGWASVLARRLDELDVDVVHTHHLGPSIYGWMAARMLDIPLVHTEHSVEFYNQPRLRMWGQLIHALADEVIAVSEAVADWHGRAFSRSPMVIENGVALPAHDPMGRQIARRTLGLNADVPVVGCVARLASEKRHDRLLKAWSRVQSAMLEARLVLFGDGPRMDELLDLAWELGVDDSVIFAGSRDDIDQLYPALDICALTSEREGLPMAALEAMSHGIPVVATGVGGLPSLLADGGGRIVDESPNAIADGLLALMSDDIVRRVEGRTARGVIERRYSIERMVASYRRVYRTVVSARSDRRKA